MKFLKLLEPMTGESAKAICCDENGNIDPGDIQVIAQNVDGMIDGAPEGYVAAYIEIDGRFFFCRGPSLD